MSQSSYGSSLPSYYEYLARIAHNSDARTKDLREAQKLREQQIHLAHKHTPWGESTTSAMSTITMSSECVILGLKEAILTSRGVINKMVAEYSTGRPTLISRSIANCPPFGPNVRRIHEVIVLDASTFKWPSETGPFYVSTTHYPALPIGWYLKSCKVKCTRLTNSTISLSFFITLFARFHTSSMDGVLLEGVEGLWSADAELWENDMKPFEEMANDNPTPEDVHDFLKQMLEVRPTPAPAETQAGFGGLLNVFSGGTDEAIGDAAIGLGTLSNDLSKLVPEVLDTNKKTSKLVENINDIVEKHSDLPDIASKVINRLNAATSLKIGGVMLKGAAYVALCSSAAMLVLVPSKESKMFFVVSMVAFLIFCHDDVSNFLNKIHEHIVKYLAPEPQAGMGPDFFEGVAVLLYGVAGATAKDAKEAFRSISAFSIDKTKANIMAIFKFFSDLVCKITSGTWLHRLIPDRLKFMYIHNEEVKDYAKKVDVLHDELKSESLLMNDSNYLRLVSLISEGESLLVKATGMAERQAFSQIIGARLTFLRNLRDKFVASNFGADGRRPIPTAVCLSGEPNTLKSQSIEHLCYALAAKTLTREEYVRFEKNPKDFIYYFNKENNFWDGFKTTHIFCVFNDFGQTIDAPGVENEYLKFMSTIEENPYMLHMAAIDKKGSTFFNCKYVILTTNRVKFQLNSIYSPAALTRRFHYFLKAYPRPEYDSGLISGGTRSYKVDYGSLPLGVEGVPHAHPRYLLYQQRDYDGGLKPKVYTFQSLVDSIFASYCEHNKWFKQKNFDLKVTGRMHLKSGPPEYVPPAASSSAGDSDDDSHISMEAMPQGGFPDMSSLRKQIVKDSAPMSFDLVLCSDYQDEARFILQQVEEQGPDHVAFKGCVVDYLQSMRIILPIEASVQYMLLMNASGFLDFVESGEYTENVLLNFMKDVDVTDIPEPPVPSLKYSDGSAEAKLPPQPSKWDILKSYVAGGFMHFYTYAEWYISSASLLVAAYAAYSGLNQYFNPESSAEPYLYCCLKEDCPGYYKLHMYTDRSGPRVPLLTYDAKFADHHKGSSDGSLKLKGVALEDFVAAVPQYIPSNLRERELDKNWLKERFKGHSSPRNANTQACFVSDPNADKLISSIMRRNCYYLEYDGDHFGTSNRFGIVTFIMDTWLVMPRHFHKLISAASQLPGVSEQGFNLRALTKDRTIKIKLSYAELSAPKISFEPGERIDLIFIKLDRVNCHIHRRIDEHFPTEVQVKNTRQINYRLVGLDGDLLNSFSGNAIFIDGVQVNLGKDGSMRFDGVVKYEASTTRGDCGSLFIALDRKTPQKIWGIHTFGAAGNIGYSTLITKEMIDRLTDKGPLVFEAGIENLIDQSSAFAYFESLFDVDQGTRIHEKSSIRRSILTGSWDCVPMLPGQLTKQAYVNAITRYNVGPFLLPMEKVKHCARSTFDFLNNVAKFGVEKRQLTFEESVFGLEGVEEFGPIPRSTSAGFPFCLERRHGQKAKEPWFGRDEQFIITRKGRELEERINDFVVRMEQGERCCFIYSDHLKDERVPVAKYQACKTRLISGSPLDLTCLVRMYFGSFCIWFVRNRIANSSAIGINVYGGEWHELVSNLVVGANPSEEGFFAGDFKAFDCSGKPGIYYEILVGINRWYGEEDPGNQIREMLWHELVQSKHIRGRQVYQWTRSLPSGHPMTSIVNTLYNLIAHRYCFFKASGWDFDRLCRFHHYVGLCCFGDDSVGFCREEVRDFFSEKVISECMADLGLTYTSDLKDGSSNVFRSMGAITFLKRSFVYSDQLCRYIAPLSLEVILTSPMWTNDSSDSEAITRKIVEGCLLELSLHGEDAFEAHSWYVLRAVEERMQWVPLTTSYLANLYMVSEKKLVCF